jgi:hypothetical protein
LALQTSKTNKGTQFAIVAFGIILFAIFTALLLSRKRATEELWSTQAEQKTDSVTIMELDTLFDDISVELPSNAKPVFDFIPEGWTIEQYTSWLDGPVPEDWTEEQWVQYVAEHKEKINLHQI